MHADGKMQTCTNEGAYQSAVCDAHRADMTTEVKTAAEVDDSFENSARGSDSLMVGADHKAGVGQANIANHICQDENA